MSTVATKSGPGKRYPARVTEFARRLYDEGRSVPEVIEALSRYGQHPSRSTVVYWCQPEARDAHNLKQKRARFPSLKRRRRELAWWAKYRRMRELREAGLSFTAIAVVMRIDFALNLSGEQVRYGLAQNGRSQSWAKRVLR